MFNRLIRYGIDRINKEDRESQDNFLTSIAKTRHMSPEIIKKFDGIFIPNDDYMAYFFGNEIRRRDYDCYNSFNQCSWLGYLVFPIYDVVEEVVGLVGFNPINKVKAQETNDWSLQYYKHSNKNLFDNGRHIFMYKGTYEKALKEGYIVLTDGVFDMVSLTENSIISGALLGSYVSEQLIAMLSFIPRIYLAVDNDEAGEKLLRSLKKYLPRTMAIKQGRFKDIDDVIQSKYKNLFLAKFKEHIHLNTYFDLIIKI